MPHACEIKWNSFLSWIPNPAFNSLACFIGGVFNITIWEVTLQKRNRDLFFEGSHLIVCMYGTICPFTTITSDTMIAICQEPKGTTNKML